MCTLPVPIPGKISLEANKNERAGFMKYGKYIIPLILFTIIGCAKAPERIDSPGLKIDFLTEDNKETFALRFSGGIKNVNTDSAFTDFKGQAVFLDPEKGGPVRVLDFTIPVVLPFDSSIIDVKAVLKQEEIMPLVKLLGIDIEKLKKEKSVEKFDIDERNIGLRNISFNKKCIIDLLKDKVK